ncbi:MAG: hypothetical protein GX605_05380 [Chloroflexi bacterium]|nr:hypothetical protein [Chloroflexota bacterium]
MVDGRLDWISAPALIIHSQRDSTIKPISAQIIHDSIASTDKELVWFHETHHEMLRDKESAQVVAEVDRFVTRLLEVGS